MGYDVVVLKTGYSERAGPGKMRASGTVTLVKGTKNIIVDTGGPQEAGELIDALSREGLRPGDVDYVVCTHGHSDHVGNNNLFPGATFIVSHDICKGDIYTFHDFKSGASFNIDELVEVVPTPGHTGQDVSVFVKTDKGVIAVAGDLFEREEDLVDESLWRETSEMPATQERSRKLALKKADFIVPGHGEMFRVKK